MLVHTKKDVALNIINQIPDCLKYSKEVVLELKQVCFKFMDSAGQTHKQSIDGYLIILNGLQHDLETKKMTSWRRKRITKQMIEITDKIAMEGKEHKQFILETFKTFGKIGIAIGTIAVSAVVCVKE